VSDSWNLTIKPSFLTELVALQPKEALQVQKKLALLAEDPTPDAKTKKQLKYMEGKLHRLRSGDFRVFYTFEHPYISVLALRKRDEDTYDDEPDADFLGGGSVMSEEKKTTAPADSWDRWLAPPPKKRLPAAQLPRAIDKALLESLSVPKPFHAALSAAGTEDELLECPVPQDILSKVIDAVLSRPITEVAAQPDLMVAHPDDLLRFREGELLGFLLRLNNEQEKFVTWAVKGKGATLLKGSPGTGKSTVALYRVREMVRALRKSGVERPRILFTTYTRALTRVSEQLLASLLEGDAQLVEVRTADAIAREIAALATDRAKAEDLRHALGRALETAKFVGNSLKVAAQRQTIMGLEKGFLLDEIQSVIESRGITELHEYLDAVRPGRGGPLNKTQREAVWRVREAFVAALSASKLTTWEQIRARAAAKVASGEVPARYDAVLIDEAQDLQPTTLRLLAGLCKSAGGVFLTADANQSIYGGGFRWSDIHEWLQFQGRTGVLRANHRSTREIALAADSYLRAGAAETVLDGEAEETRYVHAGPTPAVRAVGSEANEAKLLARFFRSATRELRLGLGACAVLCPYNKAASRIAAALSDLGLPAAKIEPEDLDLKQNGVKIITLKSAKGLEFPVVALAGFLDGDYPFIPVGTTDEDRAELVARERRTMYVAMTRPMRALLVVVPPGTKSPLLTGFSADRWNIGTGTKL
jgi:superfamily I DNA/RNA helicase/mRNA-degrading endonuclease RelE of RelBE toxin-antitoxin system